MWRKALFLTLLAGAIGVARLAAQQPLIAHARMDTRSAALGFAREVQGLIESEAGSAWIGYAVPAVRSQHEGPHVKDRWGTTSGCHCVLGGGCEGSTWNDDDAGQASLLVLLHVNQYHLVQIEPLSEECAIEANGATVHWLTGVNSAESVQLLSPYVLGTAGGGETPEHKVWQGALVAIAQTADASADEAMERFMQPSTRVEVRKDTTFWLGATRGERGYRVLRKIVQDDPADEVRRQAVFALSISPAAGAEASLIGHHAEASLRGEALFWLAQKAGKKAAGEIQDAIDSDPDTHVKKQAVFALTQLPADQGVPLLIQVAQSNHNPEVRKQAFFWLGQSKDPRALDFIERVLTN